MNLTDRLKRIEKFSSAICCIDDIETYIISSEHHASLIESQELLENLIPPWAMDWIIRYIQVAKKFDALHLGVFDKGIITRHLKNGANLHQTTPDRRYWGKLKAAVFARYGRSPLGGRPVLVIKAAPSRPRPFHPKSLNYRMVTSRQNVPKQSLSPRIFT